MRIRSVRYGRLRSLPDFNNVRLEIEAEVEEGEDWREVRDRLIEEVGAGLGLLGEISGLEYRRKLLENSVNALSTAKAAAETEVSDMRKRLADLRKLSRECSELADLARENGLQKAEAFIQEAADELPF